MPVSSIVIPEKKQQKKNSTTAVGGSSTIGNFDLGVMEKGWDGLNLSSFI